jgi:hypothetical protein
MYDLKHQSAAMQKLSLSGVRGSNMFIFATAYLRIVIEIFSFYIG